MSRRLGLRGRLLLSHLLVVMVGAVTVFTAVGLVAPGAFESAMGHSMPGMGDMMSELVRVAFHDAVQTAIIVGVIAAVLAAVVVSVVLSARLSRPISRVAGASHRIAAGRYAERVPVPGSDEIAELAASFNQMADSLESTERRRLELVGDVAHELRTPLATLDGYLEGLQDGVIAAGDPTWQLLRRETARLSRLIDDLQQLWRAEARQLPLATEPIDAAELLTATRERFAVRAGEHGTQITAMAPSDELTVKADRERLAQVLDNLVANAIRYSPEGAPIVLEAERSGDQVVLSVLDQGPGLTEEQRERVFERFYRVDPSRARVLGGSGIGLAIARALIEAMDGRIWAESDGPGRGSSFRVALPRVA